MAAHKLEKIESIENREIKEIMGFICEDKEKFSLTKRGEHRKDRQGNIKPPKLYVDLRESAINHCQMFFFEQYEDKSLSCTQFDINNGISKTILDKYKHNFEKSIILHNYAIVPFDIEGQLAGKNKIMKLSEDEVNKLSDIKRLISTANNSSSEIDFKKLHFYAIKIKIGRKEIIFFEKYEPSMRLDQSRLLKALISRQQKKFDKVQENRQHFYLKYNMSCFLFEENMYILKKPLFEKMFDYEEKYREICLKTENNEFVTELDIFDDMDIFSENLNTDNLNVLRKFSHLMDYQTEIKTLVADMTQVKKLIKDYKVKGVIIENDKICVKKSNFQSILKFLDRGQTEHRITKEKFESDNKTRVN